MFLKILIETRMGLIKVSHTRGVFKEVIMV